MDGPQQVTFFGVLSRVAKRYAVADNAQRARAEARQRFTSGLSLTGCESCELMATVVLGMHMPLPFHFAALALCHVAVLLYACDLQLLAVNGEQRVPLIASLHRSLWKSQRAGAPIVIPCYTHQVCPDYLYTLVMRAVRAISVSASALPT